MKFLIIAVLFLVAVSQAQPYFSGGDVYGRGYGGYGGGYGGGSEYDHAGFDRGDHGYLDEGYGSSGMNQGHDIRHQQNEFDSSVHQHQVSDHNSGGVSSGDRGGHLHSGHGGYESGLNDYGRDFGHGYNHGIF
ncbi:unnamed protein product [Arctia plantaginis]|uniref:Uncharacterized protein n=1 Tax=Arctia plantaginis TaxID=874455 RepID=A0A8S1BJC6_ARCPL|nr:unnamed protein product [Arctia plantaginis]